MKKSNANKSLVNVIPLEAKNHAAGSEKGQQLVPALVGVFFIVSMASR